MGRDHPMKACSPPARAISPSVGSQMEVIGVSENDLGVERPHLIEGDAFHGALRSHGHEGRRLHDTVCEREAAAARAAVLAQQLETETGRSRR